tara:strand:- start:130 stop:528 length:399 start_codon:yes stop_codon:yes gene_type:complete
MIFKINYRADLIGALASSLCVIHCMATPFIFFIKSSADLCCSETPTWWQSIDYIFLTVAFFAVLHIANNKRSSKLIKSLLIICWIGLLAVTINTTFFLFHISNELAYLPAFSLVALHLYNANLFSFLRKSKS